MRMIVACPQCKRQYDAAGKAPGDRFRCHCGEELTVGRARGHDAAIVRCASCGAPREGAQTECRYCGADFTIYERDVHTVCPSCLARVSDRARYCHHCGAVLIAEKIASEQTTHCCPVCGPDRALVGRRLSDERVAVLECEKCGGFWLSLETFEMLLEQEARSPKPSAVSKAHLEPSSSSRAAYRPCVVCGALMVRRNMGRGKSGVIVDLCGSHGIWFDADELARLVAWIRSGGLEAIRLDVARLRHSTDMARKRLAARDQKQRSGDDPRQGDTGARLDPEPHDDPFGEIGAAAAQILGHLFRLF